MNEIIDLKTLSATTSWGRGKVYDSIAETVGHTPLVRLNRLQRRADAQLVRFCSSSNSSIRCRP